MDSRPEFGILSLPPISSLKAINRMLIWCGGIPTATTSLPPPPTAASGFGMSRLGNV